MSDIPCLMDLDLLKVGYKLEIMAKISSYVTIVVFQSLVEGHLTDI